MQQYFALRGVESTSEGTGAQSLGEHGHSKDHRPDLRQMVVGVALDVQGRPICCEMWPGNTADAKRFSRPDIQLAQQINVDTHSPGELIVDEKRLEKLPVGYRELHRGIHVETPP